jgi:hypothetical protein
VAALKISTSPRSTWLWADDAQTVQLVRAVLDAGGYKWAVARRGQVEFPLVTDIEIGPVALDACQTLAAASFTFDWHDGQHVLNRAGWPTTLPGIAA